MSLFDSIAGQVLGSMSNSGNSPQGGLLDAIGGLLNDQQGGGLPGLIAAFKDKGLGEIVGSWVGTGQNLPISAEQLQSVLGNEQIQAIAQKLGLPTEQISNQLTQVLPQVIDKLTPDGTLPESGALGGLLAMLKGGST